MSSTEALTRAVPADQAPAPETGRRSMRRAGALLFLGVAFVFCISPVVTNSDSYLIVPTATSLVHHGDLHLDEYATVPEIATHYGFVTADGHRVNEFPWATTLFAVPAVVVADAGHAIGIGPGADTLVRRDEMGLLQLLSASIVTALAVVAIAVLTYERLSGDAGRRRRWALATALVVAFGTTAWSVASRALWQHGPSMLLVTVGLIAAGRLASPPRDLRARPAWVYAAGTGAALATALAIRPTNILALAAVGGWLAVTRRRALLPFALGAAAVVLPWMLVTVLSYGVPFQPYGSTNRLSLHGEYLEVLAANLVSPGRGLLVFSPVVALCFAGVVVAVRRSRVDGLLVVAAIVVVAQWLVVSAYGENWVGGHSYGPRFFTDVLPFLALLAVPAVDALAGLAVGRARTRWITATGVLVLVSVLVHAQGGVLRAAQCWNVEPVPIESDTGRVWSWSDPLLARGARHLLEGGPVFEGCDRPLRPVATPTR